MTGGLPPKALRLLDAAALAALALWAIAMLFGLPPAAPPTDSMAMVDYGLNTRQALIIEAMVANAAGGGAPVVYPNHYAYPPAFVVLMLIWLKLGAVAFPAWLCVMAASLLVGVIAGARLAGLGWRPGRLALAALAAPVALYALGWDLRTRNVNLIYLAVAVLGLAAAPRRPAMGGVLLSLSAALKLYSVLFVPWLAWRRQWRFLVWMLAGLALWFVVLPALWFGFRGAWALTLAWIDALRTIGTPVYQDIFPGYLLTLARAVAWLRQSPADDPVTLVIVTGIQAAWAAFVLWRLWRSDLAPAAEIALLLLLPLPFAPLLQPHHTVVFLVPALVLLAAAARTALSPRERLRAGAVLLGAAILTQSGPAGGGRAAMTMLATLVLALATAQRGARL
ncbi:MAG: glycosyltransferase 87 family protein [Alphaproteobacteria bacterium]|nr:glycosyltransferase 87 family protein [Alphaproteobacteria bacterium]